MSKLRRRRAAPHWPRTTLPRKIAAITVAALETLLPLTAGAFGTSATRYWRTLPVRRMGSLLLGLFFTLGGVAFCLDLVNWQRLVVWALLVSAGLLGAAAVLFLLPTND